MKKEKNYMGFLIPKVWQILNHFAGAFHQAQTSYFWGVSQEVVVKWLQKYFFTTILSASNAKVNISNWAKKGRWEPLLEAVSSLEKWAWCNCKCLYMALKIILKIYWVEIAEQNYWHKLSSFLIAKQNCWVKLYCD